jgi:hypothetical protein
MSASAASVLVATAGVLSGVLVAAITAVSSHKRERDRLMAETQREQGRFVAETKRGREDELRTVASDAATQLSNAIYHVRRCRKRLSAGQLNESDIGKLGDAWGQVSNCEDRLAIRLGNNAPEVVPYRQAMEQVHNARDLLRDAAGGHKPRDGAITFQEAEEAAKELRDDFRDVTSQRLSPDALA